MTRFRYSRLLFIRERVENMDARLEIPLFLPMPAGIVQPAEVARRALANSVGGVGGEAESMSGGGQPGVVRPK